MVVIIVTSIFDKFKEHRLSIRGVAIFAITLTAILQLNVSDKELDQSNVSDKELDIISLSVRNIDSHGNNIYIKTKEILDNDEITLEDMKYLDNEKNQLSNWCKVFDNESDIIGVSRETLERYYVENALKDYENSKIYQRIMKLNNIEIQEDERLWLEGIENRSYKILTTKIIQDGNKNDYKFEKSNIKKLYSELYNEIHEVE